jgi:release factor glutamine methyltransferase
VTLAGATTRAEALTVLRRAFATAGLDSPELDARILVAEALAIAAVELALRPEVAIGAAGAERLGGFVARRLAYEPVARILGVRDFWGLSFELSPETLVPRPDTETVVQAALAEIPGPTAAPRILDLGTGSGCLLVALLHELPEAWGVGLDRAAGALATARRNARRNGVQNRAAFAAADWGGPICRTFNLVVSNPPYVPTPGLEGLPQEVRLHDPVAALNGGPDGLAALRAILAGAPRLLAPGGTLVLEIGYDQEPAARSLAGAAGFVVRRVARDLGGRPRAVVAGQAVAGL